MYSSKNRSVSREQRPGVYTSSRLDPAGTLQDRECTQAIDSTFYIRKRSWTRKPQMSHKESMLAFKYHQKGKTNNISHF